MKSVFSPGRGTGGSSLRAAEALGRARDPRAHERVRVPPARRSRPEPPRATRAALARSRERARAIARLALLDRATPSGPRGRSSARAESSRRSGRDPRRLEADDAAPGRRDADRAAGVGSERDVDEPGGERGAVPPLDPPASRPGARGFGTVPKCGFWTRSRRRTRAGSSCRRSRSPRARAGRRPRPSQRDVLGEEDRPVRRRQAGGVEEILDGHRMPQAGGSGRARQMPSRTSDSASSSTAPSPRDVTSSGRVARDGRAGECRSPRRVT